MSSFLQRSSFDAVQVAVIAALGILLLFFVRLGSLGHRVSSFFFIVFFQYFGQNHNIIHIIILLMNHVCAAGSTSRVLLCWRP